METYSDIHAEFAWVKILEISDSNTIQQIHIFWKLLEQESFILKVFFTLNSMTVFVFVN